MCFCHLMYLYYFNIPTLFPFKGSLQFGNTLRVYPYNRTVFLKNFFFFFNPGVGLGKRLLRGPEYRTQTSNLLPITDTVPFYSALSWFWLPNHGSELVALSVSRVQGHFYIWIYDVGTEVIHFCIVLLICRILLSVTHWLLIAQHLNLCEDLCFKLRQLFT